MLAPSGRGLIIYQAYGNLYAMTGRKAYLLEDKKIPSVGVFDEIVVGDGVEGIKRRHCDLYSDSVKNLATASGRGWLKEDLESSTWRQRQDYKATPSLSPWKGVIRFGKGGKLNPRYIRPFKILSKVGTVAYRLELPKQLSRVHNTFHVLNMKKCLSDETFVILLEEIQIDDISSKNPLRSRTARVLTRTGLITPIKQNEKRAVHTVRTARPVSTARLVSSVKPFAPKIAQTSGAIRPIYPRMDNVRPRGSYSTIKRAVVNTGKGKMDTDLKRSRWVWRPKGNYLDHVSKDSGSFILKKGNPEILLQDHVVVDSGCSSHMTGNKAYLLDYEDYNGGFVAFGSDPKGDELKFNLFSVSQMCDKKNSVLFTDTECLILSLSFKLVDESQVVLKL
ncbi:hypothetical protein Tco_0120694 [Tanacetum coccineum]